MFWKNAIIAALAAATLATTVFGEAPITRPIRVGELEVHPFRLLVRRHTAESGMGSVHGATAAIDAAGAHVERQSSLVTGLWTVEIDSGKALPSGAVIDPGFRARKLLAAKAALEESGEFQYVEFDYVRRAHLEPDDLSFRAGTLWGLRNTGQDGGTAGVDVNAAGAWDITTGSRTVIVGDVDTGVLYNHLDLVENMWVNPGEIPGNNLDDDGNGFVDDIHGINAITGSGNPIDDNGHGTHTTGTIGAAANNNHGHVGVAWNVQLMALKFLAGEGFGFDSDAIVCVNYAVRHGSKVSNHSWGGGPPNRAMSDTIAAAGRSGHLLIISAGNDTSDNDSFPVYPAGYPLENIISVASINRKGEISDFSNFGRRTVHLGAPGTDIYSTVNTSVDAYDFNSGTSMAAPHVSGVAALVLAAHPKADLNEIRERIFASVVPLPGLRNNTVFGGRVDAFNAIKASADGVLEVTVSPPEGSRILVGTTNVITVRVSDVIRVTNAAVSAEVLLPVGPTNLTFINTGVRPDERALDGVYSANLAASTVLGSATLNILVNAPGKNAARVIVNYQIADRPANDRFARPEKIALGGGVVRASTQHTTRETGEPLHADNPAQSGSLWYAYTASASGKVLFETVGSQIDTVLAVYTGDTFATLKKIGAVDNNGRKRNGSLVLDIAAGETYRIAVAGASQEDTGDFRLRILPNGVPDEVPPVVLVRAPLNGIAVTTNSITFEGSAVDPGFSASGVEEVFVRVNGGLASTAVGSTNWGYRGRLVEGVNQVEVTAVDTAGNVSAATTLSVEYRVVGAANNHFTQGQILSGTNGTVNITNAGSNKEPGEPDHAGNRGGRSVWFSFVPPFSGSLSLSTANSGFDTIMGVYTGDFVDRLTEVASNDDATVGSGFSTINLSVESGRRYRIAVDGFGGASGNIRFAYSLTTRPIVALRFTAGSGGVVDNEGGQFPAGTQVVINAIPDPGFEFVQWRGTFNSYGNPLSIRTRIPAALEAVFAPIQYSDGFESGGLSKLGWQTRGSKPWVVQDIIRSQGARAARSGMIADGENSVLELTSDFREGPASFDVHVSSEPDWDVFKFEVDGNVIQTWSGVVPWSTFTFNLSQGRHTLRWTYSKDAQRSEGEDAAFLDSIILPLVVPLASDSVARLSVAEVRDGKPFFRIDGQNGQTYTVEGSTNLRNWTAISDVTLKNGFAVVGDDRFSTTRYRFFRAVAGRTQ